MQAFNSVRFFAWCERTLFATPYDYGDVRIAADPVAVTVGAQGKPMIRAEMSLAARTPQCTELRSWFGPIYLPGTLRLKPTASRYFIGELVGQTDIYPFNPAHDTCTIESPSAGSPLTWLLDSGFTPSEWHVRRHAMHAKSKTYRA